MTKALPWIRLWTEAVDDYKLRVLSFDDRWHYIAILCCKGQGVLEQPEPIRTDALKAKLGVDMANFEEIIKRLANVGLIDKTTYQPLAWNSRQFVSDQDPTAPDRLRKFREKLKNQQHKTCNADETDVKRVVKRICNGRETPSDTDTETYKTLNTLSGCAPDIASPEAQAREVLAFLNEKTGRRFEPTTANLRLIVSRIKEGYELSTLRAIVVVKHREWNKDATMAKYLRPATLFNALKCAQYRGELGS